MLDVVNAKLDNEHAFKRLRRDARNDLIGLDHLMNQHPNREALFASDFTLNLSDELRTRLQESVNTEINANRGKTLIQALERMGHETIDSSNSPRHSINSYLHLADQKQHIILDRTPYFFDHETLKTSPALVAKAIGALDDGS